MHLNPTTLKAAATQQLIWSQEFNDLKSLQQAVIDCAIAIHFSARTVRSVK